MIPSPEQIINILPSYMFTLRGKSSPCKSPLLHFISLPCPISLHLSTLDFPLPFSLPCSLTAVITLPTIKTSKSSTPTNPYELFFLAGFITQSAPYSEGSFEYLLAITQLNIDPNIFLHLCACPVLSASFVSTEKQQAHFGIGSITRTGKLEKMPILQCFPKCSSLLQVFNTLSCFAVQFLPIYSLRLQE